MNTNAFFSTSVQVMSQIKKSMSHYIIYFIPTKIKVNISFFNIVV